MWLAFFLLLLPRKAKSISRPIHSKKWTSFKNVGRNLQKNRGKTTILNARISKRVFLKPLVALGAAGLG